MKDRINRINDLLDRLGISASLVCMAHCLVTPFAIFMVPVLGAYLASIWVHIGVAFVIVPVALWAFWSGYRHHRNRWILMLGCIGVTCLGLAILFHDRGKSARGIELIEIAFMSSGGAILVSAHLMNLNLRRKCRRGGP